MPTTETHMENHVTLVYESRYRWDMFISDQSQALKQLKMENRRLPVSHSTQSCDRHKETNSSSGSDMFLSVYSLHISSFSCRRATVVLHFSSWPQISTWLEISEPAALTEQKTPFICWRGTRVSVILLLCSPIFLLRFFLRFRLFQ